ncbi:MAG TPA: translocation/assembly module TamB domain-containing protein, partial [Desulfuromonadales bacterium]|nr:translocation/assembly module TamB domain-containing protein [Desulfuromonadales bacterium]
MVTRILFSMLAVTGLLILLLIGSAAWLLQTESGTRWLLARAPAWAGIDLRVDRIDGALLGSLNLENIDLQIDGTQVRMEQLEMQTRIRGLLPLHLAVDRLQMEGLRLETPPATPPAAKGDGEPGTSAWRWPEMPAALGAVELQIAALVLSDFLWQSGAETRLQLDRFNSNVTWRNSRLRVREIIYDTPDLSVRGSLTLGMTPPLLEADVGLMPEGVQDAIEEFHLRANLQPGPDQHPQGDASLTIRGSEQVLMNAATHLAFENQGLQFSKLRISRPNRSGEITGQGRIDLGAPQPKLSTNLQFSRLNLEPETGQPLQLSGSLELTGWTEDYQGRLTLRNQAAGWAEAQLAGRLSGNLQEASLAELEGQWLGGTLQGALDANWAHGWQIVARLTGQNLDPARIDPRIPGNVNLELQADFGQQKAKPLAGDLQMQLSESMLQGQSLSGEAAVTLRGQALTIETLQLRGAGFRLRASGKPSERVRVEFAIQELANLLPEAQGQLAGSGWVHWQETDLAAALEVQGSGLAFNQWQLDNLTLLGELAESGSVFDVQLTGRNLSSPQPEITLQDLQMSLTGGLREHTMTLDLGLAEADLAAAVSGGWRQNAWSGRLTNLQVRGREFATWQLQQPAAIEFSGEEISLGETILSGDQHGELRLQGRFRPEGNRLVAKGRWQKLDLSLFNPLLANVRLTGRSSGAVDVEEGPSRHLQFSLAASGKIDTGAATYQIENSELQLDWVAKGLTGTAHLQLDNGAVAEVNLVSNQAAEFGLPRQATLKLTGSSFPVGMARPWLPPQINASGLLDWTANGQWQTGTDMDFNGQVEVREGRLSWQEEEGVITADIQEADLNWQWRKRLQGRLTILLDEPSRIDGDFSLPLPARWPLDLDREAPLTVDLQARLRERGLLALFFPSRIQESRGLLKIDLQAAGSWRQPDLQGQFSLSDARAYLPPVGIQLQDVALNGVFDGAGLEIQELQIHSGEGRLNGQGRLELTDWRPGRYRLELTGEDFQLVNLPDLRVAVTPQLRIEGQGKKLRMRGEIKLPEVIITGGPAGGPAENSPDLVVVDRSEPAGPALALEHDIQVQLILGERVLLKMAGIDARLTGDLEIQSAADRELAAYGEIQVAKGGYSTYGVRLNITRGNLFFTGGPIARPTLDILALRQVGDVEAGVQVTGTPQNPIVNLYSEPPMPDTEILSYIVLGRPFDARAGQTTLLLTAASTLLSQGESVMLQDKLKRQLGLDVLDISAGQGDVESSVITTGKYLSPDLYVSLGYSLFTNTNELKLRYDLTPSWELESNIGTE